MDTHILRMTTLLLVSALKLMQNAFKSGSVVCSYAPMLPGGRAKEWQMTYYLITYMEWPVSLSEMIQYRTSSVIQALSLTLQSIPS